MAVAKGALERLPGGFVIEEFIRERRYLKAVSPKTEMWYRHSFKAFEGATESLESAKTRVVELRQRGVSAVSVNTYLRCLNAFWRWQGKDWKIGRLKEEQKILATLTADDCRKLIQYRPTSGNLRRAHLAALTILDTGLRASEVLSLTKENVDFDQLVIKVHGKGGKERPVPFSHELRKLLWRYSSRLAVTTGQNIFFGTKKNTKVSVRNLERDLCVLGQKCGITGVRFSPHTFRHTFAVNYLRRGGDIYSLSRILGHSSITTTTIYLRSIGIDDLKRNHNRLSVLSG
jgi:integrase/recombinase XerD